MEEKFKNEKSCENCRYYSQHYSKQGIRYDIVYCGHCLNKNNKSINKKRPFEVCELWETMSIQKEKRKKAITETLETMLQKLNEMLLILKDDGER